jgi:hypothetical protein
MAIHQAPGVLAVNVDYETELAEIGTGRHRPVPREQILESLKLIGYTGKFIDQPTQRKD